MAKADALETGFKRTVRGAWKGWSSTVEWAPGGDPGFPDTTFLVNGNLLPVEFKRADLLDDRVTLVSHPIRPDQIGWHDRLRRYGGKSLFMFGVLQANGQWDAYWSFPEQVLKADLWRKSSRSFSIGLTTYPVDIQLGLEAAFVAAIKGTVH